MLEKNVLTKQKIYETFYFWLRKVTLSRFDKKSCCEENEGWKGQFSCQDGKRPNVLFILKAAQQTSHALQGLMSYNVYQRFRLNLRSLFLSNFHEMKFKVLTFRPEVCYAF